MVGLSLHSLSLLRTTFARFRFAPPRAGLASIVGAKEKRLSHASKFAGFDMILRRILRSTAAREALETLVMSGVQEGWCNVADGSSRVSSDGWLASLDCDSCELLSRSGRRVTDALVEAAGLVDEGILQEP